MVDHSGNTKQIERICDDFDGAWATGDEPDLGEFLDQISESLQPQLLDQLLPIDVEYRLRTGKTLEGTVYAHLGDTVVDKARGLIKQGVMDETESLAGSSHDQPGQIGPYKLLQQIGEGGMGSVWMADQEQPVRRRVALKLIRTGLDDQQVIARFEAERQALAMMDHRNIARVLDAGATEQGNPYFVMELVKGVPITEYCDGQKSGIHERLALMIDVCKAVQHAHQKGIIHRDLKPSNVLVAVADGKPVPKVIDFGLAKALEHTTKLSDKTMFTEFGQVMGTLQYMSPEQANLDSLDVDSRTDVYALGVMLYELLTGSTPLDKQTIGNQGFLQVLRLIREQEPPKPSSRLSSAGEKVSRISDQRKIAPARLQGILRGELDWVVMKALEKDRSRRYETANGLAEDLRRYLENDPVQARPPSTAYRVRKFVRKHRGLVASLATIAVLLIAGIFGTTWFAFNSLRAEEKALENQAIAEKSAEHSERILTLMIESFERPDPSVEGSSVTVASILDRAVERFKFDPDIDSAERIRLLQAIASSYRGLGLHAEERDIDEFVLPLLRDLSGENDIATINAMGSYATSLSLTGDNKDAVAMAEEALARRRRYFPDDRENIVKGLTELADIHLRGGNYPECVRYASEATELGSAGSVSLKLQLAARQTLAYALQVSGEYERACEIIQEVREVLESEYGPRDTATLRNSTALAIAFSRTGDFNEAISTLERDIPLMEEVLGENHLETLKAMNVLAVCYTQDNQSEKALQTLEQVVGVMRQEYPPQNHDRLAAEHSLAMAYQGVNELDKARSTYEHVVEQWNSVLGKDHPDTLRATGNLALVHLANDDMDEAIELFSESLTLRQNSSSFGPDHPETLWCERNLAAAYLENGDLERGIEILEELVPRQERLLGVDDPSTRQAKDNLQLAREMLTEQADQTDQ
ncbi:MAG: tetratricopeptide repeat protein [Pirellulaceae bacterium]